MGVKVDFEENVIYFRMFPPRILKPVHKISHPTSLLKGRSQRVFFTKATSSDICNLNSSQGLNCTSLPLSPTHLPGATNTHPHQGATGEKAERWRRKDTTMKEKSFKKVCDINKNRNCPN